LLYQLQDLDKPIASGKNIDAAGAGASSISPGWLTQLNLLWGGKSVSHPDSSSSSNSSRTTRLDPTNAGISQQHPSLCFSQQHMQQRGL
jgi:hypothetical protein